MKAVRGTVLNPADQLIGYFFWRSCEAVTWRGNFKSHLAQGLGFCLGVTLYPVRGRAEIILADVAKFGKRLRPAG